ncbi:MAG: DUF4124 domain-containing protein [Burkholderiaceae bacterium]|nr:MAG: DUF4124 domain-containing protein [Burkholderiaceae bacterium]MCC7288512.1 DUF4124 domain-containing protein [Burkholderiaceae bacterium]
MRLSVWFCVGFSLCVAALPAAAQWKWRDARGVVVISDTPPPREIPERDVMQRPTLVLQRQTITPAASAAASGAAVKPKVDPELEARRKKAEADQQAQQKAEETRVAAQRADNCKRARAYADSLNSGIRLSRVNDKGEREILDDQQRAGEMQRARQAIEANCQ